MHVARSYLFGIARAIGKHPAAGALFCLTERFLPLQRQGRSGQAVAFMHPRPSYDPHILIVPTRPFPSLTSDRVGTETKATLLANVVRLAQHIAETADPTARWQLIINGGERQDVGQVHGHLVQNEAHPAVWPLSIPIDDWSGARWRQVLAMAQSASSADGYSLVFELGDSAEILVATT